MTVGIRQLITTNVDKPLFTIASAILLFGLVMVASSSIAETVHIKNATQLHFFNRQLLFAIVGVVVGFIVLQLPLSYLERYSHYLLILGIVMLLALLIPGVGKTVNYSTRWIAVGPFSIQISEFVKLFAILYLAGYLVRHHHKINNNFMGMFIPFLMLSIVASLIVIEPDLGAAATLLAVVLGMMFLGGARLAQFMLLILLLTIGVALVIQYGPEYRINRLLAFMNDPWLDPYSKYYYQISQALISYGRGEWFGSGLGASIQKLDYLPEAHTDFIFSVIAEEFGLIGSAIVILAFAALVWRIFIVAKNAMDAGHYYGAHLTHGVALWFMIQAFVNIGVNMNVLPTKGLTLPLISYGGSSMLTMLIALAIVLRVHSECSPDGKRARIRRSAV